MKDNRRCYVAHDCAGRTRCACRLQHRKPADSEKGRALEEFSNRERWWVRLYVAQLIAYHHEFGQAEVIDRLVKDEHSLVSGEMKRGRSQ